MITHLLDTSVYSQPVRKPRSRCDPALRRWGALGDQAVAVSIVSYSETRLGLALAASPTMQRQFEQTLDGRLTILPADSNVWDEFVSMKARQKQIGQPVADFDLLIAATARANSLIVATLNTRDFSRIEALTWEDWST
jgi:tRNA(fMet)-specific endonuclease VapC